jgi:hypothetical protein
MNAIREHYERVLLIAATATLFLSCILIWRSATRLASQLAVMSLEASGKNVSPFSKSQELAAAADKMHRSPQWTFDGRSGLFVPEEHFIGANGLPATLQTTQVHPPVTNEWIEQFGLPIADANVLEQDPDNDGFNNLEEWVGHTKPTDPNSHPEYYTKLKLKSATEEPFRLVFSSWVGDAYAINTIDMKQPTQFVRIGDSIIGTQFKVVKFVEKYEPNNYGTNVDVSELILEQEETREQITLVKEKVAMSPESVATFSYTWNGRREFSVRNEQEFSLNPQEQTKYKLINVEPTKAVIVLSHGSGEPIEIGLFSP